MRRKLFAALTAAAAVSAALASSPAGAAQLVMNGDFSQGATGFTSSYTQNTPQTGSYSVGTDPSTAPNHYGDWASFGDHTTGAGQMLIADGASPNYLQVWQEPIALQAGTTYNLSFYARTINVAGGDPAFLQFMADGTPIGPGLSLTNTSAGGWQNLSWSYTPDHNIASIGIHDINSDATWNDFAVDDISVTSPVPAGAVPEPASWALMMIGVFGMGAVLRRNPAMRSAQRTAAA